MNGRMVATAAIAALLCAASLPAGAQSAFTLAAKPVSGPAPLSVTFTVSPMPPPDSAIDFGDGSAASTLRPSQSCASCAAVTHVYQANGRYLARASAGASVVGSATISVGATAN
jgi:PKD repeat protein